ncbi:DUF6115 domain-containing protein [Ammoniphilus resinae]|uniref:RNase H-like nuclease (RuvC/YqgF family) n=1 Tax=Ammoniphilus resinae TaxID=861532 RepID=A0ABS4GMW3_9BACL|nr:hypothetical protein [Ammoniphilus resinae]MBP1931452.1 putative RNase H-like nuclease (RuvC/YqgF family) [Ammoniphilus resinae]
MQDDLFFYLIVLGLILVGVSFLRSGRNKPDLNATPRQQINDPQYREYLHFMSELKKEMERRNAEISYSVQELRKELTEIQSRLDTKNGSTVDGQGAMRLDHRYAEIFALKQQGKSMETIAKQLDMGVGEVELILQLHAVSSVSPGQR